MPPSFLYFSAVFLEQKCSFPDSFKGPACWIECHLAVMLQMAACKTPSTQLLIKESSRKVTKQNESLFQVIVHHRKSRSPQILHCTFKTGRSCSNMAAFVTRLLIYTGCTPSSSWSPVLPLPPLLCLFLFSLLLSHNTRLSLSLLDAPQSYPPGS